MNDKEVVVSALCGTIVKAEDDGDLTLTYADGRVLVVVPMGHHGEFESLV